MEYLYVKYDSDSPDGTRWMVGAWQVGVHWEKVLPAWFKVLSATAEPDERPPQSVTLAEELMLPRQRVLLARIVQLADKSTVGQLTEEEKAEYEGYVRAEALRDHHPVGRQDRAGGGGADRHRRVPRVDRRRGEEDEGRQRRQ